MNKKKLDLNAFIFILNMLFINIISLRQFNIFFKFNRVHSNLDMVLL